jgi:REP element-mobilizing transposase RayT
MARKLRIQYPGALYHVINRGNYRRDVFETPGAAQAWVHVLSETTALYGWRVHAYVVMRNHYHLAVETPVALPHGEPYLGVPLPQLKSY